MTRQEQELKADDLDRKLHICRLRAEEMPFLDKKVRIGIQILRGEVRQHMNPKDRERTAGA